MSGDPVRPAVRPRARRRLRDVLVDTGFLLFVLSGCGEPTAPRQSIALKQVSAGAFHTCALTLTGTAYCWGADADGQLGAGGSAGTAAPVPVSGGLAFESISAGYDVTCGIVVGGTAYCWGSGPEGQLGAGTTLKGSVPVAVSGGLRFESISVGDQMTCGVADGGAAYCWGVDTLYALGDRSAYIDSSSPVPVAGGLTFADVQTGFQYACGLTPGGAAYCWGYNGHGQLGDGDTRASGTPVRVAIAERITSLGVGRTHACALTSHGAAYCWGSNDDGALGNGTIPSGRVGPPPGISVPAVVSGGLTFASISAGDGFTCGVAPGGGAYCWGDDAFGELGDGRSAMASATPVPVSGGHAFAIVTAGFDHACGITTSGRLYCWGGNSGGQLGEGAKKAQLRTRPVRVAGP